VPVDSVYRWEGEVESAAEVLLLIKTRAALIEPVTVAVKAAHSYATPEIIAVPITSGLPAYLSWIDSVTG
jgi:periplasmic divalent cation tolerance protein